jgi:excisionase family DNA binding protein
MNPNALSPEEAADLVGVDVSTLKRWARAGKVPGAWQTPGGWWKFTRAGLFELVQPSHTDQ